jgi:hypothetical protein
VSRAEACGETLSRGIGGEFLNGVVASWEKARSKGQLGMPREGGEGGWQRGERSGRHWPGRGRSRWVAVALRYQRRNRGGQSPTGGALATVMGGDSFV